MMKFKVGDKVRVRSWESMLNEFGADGTRILTNEGFFVSGMSKHCGRIVTIESIGIGYYCIRETGFSETDYAWTDDMFEDGVVFTKNDFKSGMVVEIANGDRFLAVGKDGIINFMNLNGTSFFTTKSMSDDMTFPISKNHNIMKVFESMCTLNGCKSARDIIWERPEVEVMPVKEMTVSEIEKALGYPVKVIKE